MTPDPTLLAESLDRLGQSLQVDYPDPAHAREGALFVSVRRETRPPLGPAVQVAVVTRPDLLPTLRAAGYEWALTPQGADRPAARGVVAGGRCGWGPDLPPGRYRLRLTFRPAAVSVNSQPVLHGEWSPRRLRGLAAKEAFAECGRVTVAQFSASDSSLVAEVVRTPAGYPVLRVKSTAHQGRPVRFTLSSPNDPATAVAGYIGIGDEGVGEVSLFRLDHRTPTWLWRGVCLDLVLPDPSGFTADDRAGVGKSAAAASIGGEVLRQILVK